MSQDLHSLWDQLPVVVYRVPLERTGGARYVSPRIEQLLGYPPAEWLQEPGMWQRRLHPEDRERVLAEVRRAVATRGEFMLEYRMIRRDERVVWVQDWGRVQWERDGGVFLHGVLLDVTDRKEAEYQRRELQSRLHALLQVIPAVIYAVDPEPILLPDGMPAYRWQYVNDAIEELTGYPAEAFRTDLALYVSLIHPEDRERVQRETLQTDETGEPFALDYRLIRRDGRVVWVREYALLLRDAAGCPVAWQGVIVDVTPQKQMEEALRTAESRYRALVEQLPGALLVSRAQPTWLPDGTPAFELIYASPQLEHLTGYPITEWKRPGFWIQHVHPEDARQLLEQIACCLFEQREVSVEYRFSRADGRVIWIRHLARLLEWENEERGFWQSLLIDVTEEKQAEEARRQSEELFRLLAEQHPGAVTIVEPEPVRLSDGTLGWRTLYCSPRVVDFTGYTPEEWSELGVWLRGVHPDDRPRVLQVIEDWPKQGPSEPIEYRFLRKDGRVVWLREEGSLVTGPDGRPRYLFLIMLDVTKERELLERLRLAEERYRVLVEQLPGAVLLRTLLQRDTQTNYLYVSPGIERLTGYRPEEWSAELFFARLHPDDREWVQRVIREADAHDTPLSIEYRLIRKDGALVWIWSQSHVVRAMEGAIGYRHVLLIDITARRQAEEALRLAEERYRTLVEQLPAAVVLVAPNRVVLPDGLPGYETLYVSPQIEDLTGYTPEEWRTLGVWARGIFPDDRTRVLEAISRAEAQDEPVQLEYRFVRKDGRIVWLWHEFRGIHGPDGTIQARQAVFIDLTARKRIEEELRAAEERYRTLVEQIPAAVMVTAAIPVILPDGGLHYPITFLSRRIEEITGFAPQEFAERPGLWFSRIHPDDQPVVAAEARRTDETGEPFQVTYRFQRKDGRWVWLENREVLLRDAQGSPLFWHGLLLDVTERKRAESFVSAQSAILRLIVDGAPLPEVLETLCRQLEAIVPETRWTIVLIDEDGRFQDAAAPSMPAAYHEALQGLPVSDQAGCCGQAAIQKAPAVCTDILRDPRFERFHGLARAIGVRSCAAAPIQSGEGRIIGVASMYRSEAGEFPPEDLALLKVAADSAALALERWRESDQLRHRALHDPLTGVPNRLLFLDRLEHALSRISRDGGGIAVLFIDLDEFKAINDTWGHGVGDQVLVVVAQRLREHVRAGDTVARFAGDEFTVLLEQVTSEESVHSVAERLLAAFKAPITVDELALTVRLSIGAAMAFGPGYPTSGQLLLAADQALYAAKRAGKGQVAFVTV